MLYAKSLHRKIGNRGVKIHRPDPREAASKTATKAVFSGLILVPKDYVPSKERSTASKGADWLRLAGLSLSDLGGGGSMDKVEEEAWNLYVAMNKARAEGDINQINLLCADPVARMLIHEIKVGGVGK